MRSPVALRRFSNWAVPTLALAMFGCDADVALSDSVDDVIDFGHDLDADRSLHSPYVVGAQFELRLAEGGDGAAFTSSDASILALDGGHATALAPGQVEIFVFDATGGIAGTAEIEVRMPTRVVLHAAAPVFLDRSDVPTEVTRPRIVEGGEATFLVEYFDGATRLAGSGGLEVYASEGVVARVSGELHGERRDWVTIAGDDSGIEQVSFAVGDEVFTAIDVDVVHPELVADLDVLASEDGPDVVIAMTYDLDGEAVQGLALEWRLPEGAEQLEADLVRYSGGAGPMELVASYGELEGATAVD